MERHHHTEQQPKPQKKVTEKPTQKPIKKPEWTTEQSNEIDLIMTMQGALTDISAETFEENCQFFLNSIYVKTEKLYTDLVRNIMAWSVFHPRNIYLYADLLKFLETNDEYVHQISSHIIISTVVHLMFKNKFAPLEPPPLHVLMQCYLRGSVSATEIVKSLGECFVEKRSACFVISAYFLFFAPEVEELNISLYNEIIHFIEIVNISRNKNVPANNVQDMLANIDFFQKNNWEKLRAYRSHIHCMNPLLKLLVEDDIEELRKMSAFPSFDVDQCLNKNPPLSPFYFINDQPTLICAAAALNAVKCFKYLLLMDASLSKLSGSNQGAAAYAAMSGNLEILRIVEHKGCDFAGTLQMSVTFHNNDMFFWLHESKFPDLLQPSPENKSVLGQIGSSNNATILMYCLEQGLDINRIDENGECMLERAAYFGCNEVAKIALMLPDVDVNLKTKSPPMCAAAFNGNLELAKMFMEKPNTDPNIFNDKFQTPIELAAASSHFSTFDFLINLPRISIDLYIHKTLFRHILSQNDIRIYEAFRKKYESSKNSEMFNFVNFTCDERTALHYACMYGSVDLVKYLISQPGIEINPVCGPKNKGETPLDFAIWYYQPEVFQLLVTTTNAVSNRAKDIKQKILRDNQKRAIEFAKLNLVDDYLRRNKVDKIEIPMKTHLHHQPTAEEENNGQVRLLNQQEYDQMNKEDEEKDNQ